MQNETRSSLSDSFVYGGNKPKAAPATKSRVHIFPENGTSGFNPGNTIKFVIPTGNRGHYLKTRQSYLKFKLQNLDSSAANKLTLDHSAHAVIRSLKVSASGGAGGGMLEHIEECNALFHALVDVSGDANQVTYAGTIVEGFNQEVNGDSSRVFCIPLMSAVIGSTQKKYLPVGAMARTHFTLELTLGDVEKIQDGNRPWAVKDVEYVGEMIHLDPMVDRELLAVNNGGIVVPFSTYSQHRWIASNGSGSMSMAFSSPYKSLKTLFTIFRKDESSYDAKPYVTKRANPIDDIGRYQFTINGVLTPSKPVEGNSEAWAEVMKAFHAYGAIDHIGKLTTADWTAREGKYLIECDLES